MGVSVDTLKDKSHYRLICQLSFGEVLPFVMKQIRKRGAGSLFYLLVNIAMLALIPVIIILGLYRAWFTWQSILWQIPVGIFAGSILIIPIHEAFHGLAYLLLGARKIIFGSDLSQFIFFVTAREHPVSGRQLYFLALLPFILINLLVVTIATMVFPGAILVFTFLLFSHNLMCIGDFAMVNYAALSRAPIYNYDDPENRISYFYEEITTRSPKPDLRS